MHLTVKNAEIAKDMIEDKRKEYINSIYSLYFSAFFAPSAVN